MSKEKPMRSDPIQGILFTQEPVHLRALAAARRAREKQQTTSNFFSVLRRPSLKGYPDRISRRRARALSDEIIISDKLPKKSQTGL